MQLHPMDCNKQIDPLAVYHYDRRKKTVESNIFLIYVIQGIVPHIETNK